MQITKIILNSEKKSLMTLFSTPNSAYYGISVHIVALLEFEILEILALRSTKPII